MSTCMLTKLLVSAHGDKLWPPLKDKHSGASSAGGDAREEAPPAAGDVEVFPSLGMAATRRLTAPARARVSACKQPAQQRALQNRLLFLNNVGTVPEVTGTSFRSCFGKYIVVDAKRPLDSRTKLPLPTASVMFVSTKDRDAALRGLKGMPTRGRNVTVEVPKTIQNGI